MADELSHRERALRRLPLPYSLAMRLRDAGISADALDGLYRVAEAKLRAAQNVTDDRYHARSAPRIRCFEGQYIRGIVEFDSAPDTHIASAQAMCPSKPSDSAIVR
jgi:hypothetical protein